MNIAIVDADLIYNSKQRFPNLACMKLSGYYKKLGNKVWLVTQYPKSEENSFFNFFDKVFISKVFTATEVPQWILELDNVEYDGTGFNYDNAKVLPYEIEHHMPDYNLYDNWVSYKISKGIKPKELRFYTDYSIGFTTRGCFRQCWFCVNKNCTKAVLHSTIKEFYDPSRKYILLLDDNVLACKDWKQCFDDLISTGKPFQYKQGLDERILTEEKCEYLFNKSKWHGDYIFAFDNYKDKDIILKKLKMLRDTSNKSNIKFYVFCAGKDPYREYTNFWKEDIEETFKRISILGGYKCLPYIMRYEDYDISPYRGIYINLASYCNQPSFFKKMTFRDFCRNRGISNQQYSKYKNRFSDYVTDGFNKGASWRYMEEFEQEYPDIAKKYFDQMFWSHYE